METLRRQRISLDYEHFANSGTRVRTVRDIRTVTTAHIRSLQGTAQIDGQTFIVETTGGSRWYTLHTTTEGAGRRHTPAPNIESADPHYHPAHSHYGENPPSYATRYDVIPEQVGYYRARIHAGTSRPYSLCVYSGDYCAL